MAAQWAGLFMQSELYKITNFVYFVCGGVWAAVLQSADGFHRTWLCSAALCALPPLRAGGGVGAFPRSAQCRKAAT